MQDSKFMCQKKPSITSNLTYSSLNKKKKFAITYNQRLYSEIFVVSNQSFLSQWNSHIISKSRNQYYYALDSESKMFKYIATNSYCVTVDLSLL